MWKNSTQSSVSEKRVHKWLKRFLLISVGGGLVFLLLFSIFIVNPFERNYQGNLLPTMAAGSDALVYVPRVRGAWEKTARLLNAKALLA